MHIKQAAFVHFKQLENAEEQSMQISFVVSKYLSSMQDILLVHEAPIFPTSLHNMHVEPSEHLLQLKGHSSNNYNGYMKILLEHIQCHMKCMQKKCNFYILRK